MIGRLAADASLAVSDGWSDWHPSRAPRNAEVQNLLIMCLVVHGRGLADIVQLQAIK